MADGTTPAPVAVLIVDDHRMFAQSLARLLEDDDRITVVGVAATSAEGILAAAELGPAVVLVDFQLPDLDGVATARAIRAQHPETMVVMLTGSTDDRVLLGAIDAGCSGYITKDRVVDDVAGAIVAAAAGEALISPAQLARLLPRLSTAGRAASPDLTDRERQLLACMAEGLSNKAIAARLNLSINTVRNYVQNTLGKLDAHSKLEAVAAAIRQGIISYPSGPEPPPAP